MSYCIDGTTEYSYKIICIHSYEKYSAADWHNLIFCFIILVSEIGVTKITSAKTKKIIEI